MRDAWAPPNILAIMGDGIGCWNLSACNLGMMGYRTPNIDRIAQKGMLFTDACGEQSCTAGRAAFITGQSPFRSEKNSNWEGAFRIPQLARWPGHIKAGSVSNAVFSLQDWLPTLLAAAGNPDITTQLLEGYQVGGREFRAHLDGYNQIDRLTGGGENPRSEFFSFSDGGDLVGIRTEDRWKILLMEQRAEGLDVWFEPFDDTRTPRIVDLRGDPFERALDESSYYDDWLLQRLFVLYPVRGTMQAFFETFVAFPPRQPDSVLGRYREIFERIQRSGGG